MFSRSMLLTVMLVVLGTGAASASPRDTVSTFPYVQDFEGTAASWTTGTTAGGPNDWVIGTPSKVQLSGAHGGTKAFVTKVTGNYSNSQGSYVQSPSFNMTSLAGIVTIEFWQNFNTQPEWDGGALEISVNGGTIWHRVDSTLGTPPDYGTALSSGWYNTANSFGTIPPPFWSDLSTTYAGNTGGWVKSSSAITGIAGLPDVRFRWRFSSDASDAFEGWAIDDIRVSALPPHDIGVASVRIPGYNGGPIPGDIIPLRSGSEAPPGWTADDAAPTGLLQGTPVTLNAVVKNYGASAETTYQVGWRFDASLQPGVSNAAPLAIAGRETLQLTLSSPPAGVHTVKAWSLLPTDPFPANDSSQFTFEVLDTNVVFYEGFNGSIFPPLGWTSVNADGNTGPITNWYTGSFTAPQEGGGVAGDDYRTANGLLIDDYLITPNTGSTFDAFSVDSLSFFIVAADGSFPDSVQVLVSTSTTDPDSFTTLLEYIRPTGTWTKHTYALPSAAIRYVAFRYLLYNGGPSGANSDAIGLDNVRITRYSFSAILSAPAAAAFDSVVVGQSRIDTVVVSNTGNLPLSITGASITGSTDFSVVPPGLLLLPPSASASLYATYTPSVVGPANATLVITHTGDNTPTGVALDGTGIQPAFSLSVTSVAFDSVAVDSSKTDSVVVSNPGSAPLSLSSAISDNPSQYSVSPGGPVTLQPGSAQKFTLRFHPTTFGVKTGRILFTHNAPGSPDSVQLTGTGFNLIPFVFLTVPPETLASKNPATGKFWKAAKRGKGLVPNWANLMEETVAQGGFRPGATESDSAGGMRIGISYMIRLNPVDPIKPKWKPIKDSAAVRCWIRLGSWDFKKNIGKSANKIPKTLENKLFTHVGSTAPARGLDSTLTPGTPKRKKLVKQQTKLDPKKTPNKLYAELVSLKFSIAASQLQKTPLGFGELVYTMPGSPFDGLTLARLSNRADVAMTYWGAIPANQVLYDSLFAALYRINRAFRGRMDTVHFEVGGQLLLKGSVDVATIPFLTMGTEALRIMEPTTTITETEDDLDDQENEEGEGLPVAAEVFPNYPNPFNPSTTISFQLRQSSEVTITVFDMLGREIAQLADREEFDGGMQEVEFDAAGFASGVYFYRIDARELEEGGSRTVATGKMVLLK
jgi:hypothetical protein